MSQKQLTKEQLQRLNTTVMTVELTGTQLALLVNALNVNLRHREFFNQQERYGTVYFRECAKAQDYLEDHIKRIIGDDGEKRQKRNKKIQG